MKSNENAAPAILIRTKFAEPESNTYSNNKPNNSWQKSRYRTFSRDIRSVALQYALLEFMARQKLDSLSELYPKLKQANETTSNEIRNGDWRKRLAGTALSQTSYKGFNKATSYRCYHALNHCIWLLLEHPQLLKSHPYQVINGLPKHIRKLLLHDSIKRNISFQLLTSTIKQSYKQQRLSFYQQSDLDGFTALLLTAIFQQVIWHHKRPTSAEELAKVMYKELFQVKYPLNKFETVIKKINGLLEHYEFV